MFVIAGATGHVGSVAAEELLTRKQPVKVIVRDATKGTTWSKRGAEVAVGTLEDQGFLTRTLRGAMGFFTLMPQPPFTSNDYYGHQRKMADSIAAAVRESHVPNVAILSSLGAELAAGTGPIRGLHYLEEVLRETEAHVTAIRCCYFQENVAGALNSARNQGVYPNFSPSADRAMPMIATRDIGIFAAQTLLDHPSRNEVVDLLGPTYSPRQVAEKLGAALNKSIRIVDIPESGWVQALIQAGMPRHFADVMAEMYRAHANNQIKPNGDRLINCKLTIDDVIRRLVS